MSEHAPKSEPEIAEINQQIQEHATWTRIVNTSEVANGVVAGPAAAEDIGYAMWLEAHASNEHAGNSLRQVVKAEVVAAENSERRERLRALARLSMRVRTGAANAEELEHYYTMKGLADKTSEADTPKADATNHGAPTAAPVKPEKSEPPKSTATAARKRAPKPATTTVAQPGSKDVKPVTQTELAKAAAKDNAKRLGRAAKVALHRTGNGLKRTGIHMGILEDPDFVNHGVNMLNGKKSATRKPLEQLAGLTSEEKGQVEKNLALLSKLERHNANRRSVAMSVADSRHPDRQNQDAVLWDAEHGVYGVFDGVGEDKNASAASNAAVEAFKLWAEFLPQEYRTEAEAIAAMKLGFQLARDQVSKKGENSATTASAATVVKVANKDYLLVGNAGDSRILTSRQNKNVDAQGLAEQPDKLYEALAEQGKGNMVFNAFGPDPDKGKARDEFALVPIEPGMRVVLCSDGITGDWPDQRLSQAELKTIFSPDLTPSEAAALLLTYSKKSDDKSAIVVDFE